MPNDNFKNDKDIFTTTAKEIANRIAMDDAKKNYPQAQPAVISEPKTQLTKVVVSLFSFNRIITKIGKGKD